ncbi:MAG: HAD family hydrolase [Alphaproteobacteria bacterium]
MTSHNGWTIAFDADETLWHNDVFYKKARNDFTHLIAPNDADIALKKLHDLENKNRSIYGFGMRSVMLNMIELAAEYDIASAQIFDILQIGKKVLNQSFPLSEGIEDLLKSLKAQNYRLICVTKGDLKDQKYKMSTTPLEGYFEHIEVVIRKDENEWQHIIKMLNLKPQTTVMVGDSLKGDILPALNMGFFGVWIPQKNMPYFDAYQPENIPSNNPRFKQLSQINKLPQYLEHLKTQKG